MRVAISLMTWFPGTVGGGETLLRRLLAQMAADGTPRLTLFVNELGARAVTDWELPDVEIRGVPRFRAGRRRVSRTVGLAAAAVRRPLAASLVGAPDVVHYPLTVGLPRFAGPPSLVTLHDLAHHDLRQLYGRRTRLYRALAYDASFGRADRVLTVSRFTRDRAIEILGLDPGRIDVVPQGPVDPASHRPGPVDDDRAALGGLALPPEFILYPAALWPHKNHDRLVDALAAQPHRDLHLVLTGATLGELPALMDRARAAGVADRVHHLGFVPDVVVPALYRAARALVFPSLYEGFGAPPLEAMGCGCPVASSTSGSLPEVCGDAALLFEATDVGSIAAAIERIVGDGEIRAKLRDMGLRQAVRFTPAAAARAHAAAYNAALHGPGRAA